MINMCTKLTYIFAVIALCEFVVGILTQNYLVDYHGSFFEQTLPTVFLATILVSILCNLFTVIVAYVKR